MDHHVDTKIQACTNECMWGLSPDDQIFYKVVMEQIIKWYSHVWHELFLWNGGLEQMKELVKMKCLWGSNPNGPKTDIGCIGEMIKKSLFYRKHNRYSITFGINHNFDTDSSLHKCKLQGLWGPKFYIRLQ